MSHSEDDCDPKADLAALRSFHLSDPPAVDRSQPKPAAYLPALLYPFRDPQRVRSDYPLFLSGQAGMGSEEACIPLAVLLQMSMDRVFPEMDQAKILRDNLHRLEHRIQQDMAGCDEPMDATSLLCGAADSLQQELALRGESAQRLQEDSQALQAVIPAAGTLLAFSNQASLQLQLFAVRQRLLPRRAAYDQKIKDLCLQLQSLLEVERQKDDSAHQPESLSQSVGSAVADCVDPQQLAQMLGAHRGSETMQPQRRQRLQDVLQSLQSHLLAEPPALLTVLRSTTISTVISKDDLPEAAIQLMTDAQPCARAAAHFDAEAQRLTGLFAAVRMAELELAGKYDEARHDSWFAQFTWEAFTRQELLLLPRIVVLESADKLCAGGMQGLSKLLLSGRPVQVMVVLNPAAYPGDDSDDPLRSFRMELGYLGIGHREVLVQQSTAARPQHLLGGFLQSMDAARASLHIIASGLDAQGAEPVLGAWLHANVAVESRAHPLFLYNPEAGNSWARRLDFSGNPAPEDDWTVQPLPMKLNQEQEQNLPVAFTFADHALLDPVYAGHFAPVAASCESEDLLPLSTYLGLQGEAKDHAVPFIWAADAEGKLCRLVVTRMLAQACRDRLNFWHTLQELAGVHNEHVLRAVAEVKAQAANEAAKAQQLLRAEHQAELQRLRAEAAGEAMQGLAQMLLQTDMAQLDLSAAAPAAPAEVVAPLPAAAAVAAPAEEETAAAEVEEEESFDEPWIETPLCTSCNDCTNINPRLFVYDANKQASIGDPHAGTYAQLVEAAEKCPAHCIHPGLPLDKSEANLEALMERAKPLN